MRDIASRHLCLLCTAIALTATIGACGSDDGGDDGKDGAPKVPAGAIAVVGEKPVTEQMVNTRLAVALRSGNHGTTSSSTGPDGKPLNVIPKPACLRSFERRLRRDGAQGLSEERLAPGQACAESYEFLKRAAREAVLRTLWTEQEAEDRGVTVSDAEIRERYEQTKRGYPTQRAFRQAYRNATKADLMAQQREILLTQKVLADYGDGEAQTKLYAEQEKRRREQTRCRPTETLTAFCEQRLPSTTP